MDSENVSVRLKHFLTESGLSPSVFADTCGIPRPTLSQLLNGRNKKISDVLIGLIHKAYPDLSVMWLLFGEGDMMVQKNDSSHNFPDREDSPVSSYEFSDENSKFTDEYTGVDEFLKGNGYKQPQMAYKGRYNSAYYGQNLPDKKLGIPSQDSQKLRSVVRITVFYDDNSYETFEHSKK